MKKINYTEFKTGRCFLGSLPHDQDIIASVESFCREKAITLASFSVTGNVSCYTIGTYDINQQVYVTLSEKIPCEIAACSGHVLIQDSIYNVRAQIVLADMNKNIFAGRLFSDTLVFAGEIDLKELKGPLLKKVYDPLTGLMLWDSLGDVQNNAQS